MDVLKFVTLDNLSIFLAKIKNYFTTELGKLTFTPSDNDGKFVQSVSQANGKITVTYDDIEISDVTDLRNELDTLSGAITQAGTKATVTVEALATPSNGMFKSYAVKQNGTQVGATIDIPKDFLVKSGEITDGTGDNVDKKVLKLTINAKDGDGEAQSIEIPVNDLCDVYTAGDGLQEASNKFSVKINSDTDAVIKLSATSDGLAVSYTAGEIKAGNKGLVNGGDVYTSQQLLASDISDLKGKVGEESVSSQIESAIDDAKEELNSSIAAACKVEDITYDSESLVANKKVDLKKVFVACTDEEINGLFN